jgi:hypothetical protein
VAELFPIAADDCEGHTLCLLNGDRQALQALFPVAALFCDLNPRFEPFFTPLSLQEPGDNAFQEFNRGCH